MCGSFYFYTMSNRIPFQKPYTSAHDLVCLLQSRGLTVTDTAKAESYLEYIGYYRLSAYMYPLLQMPKEQHRYKPNTTFSQVMMLYRFDKKLRLLIFNEIEKIEVAVRSAIVNIGSAMTDNPFWMTDCRNFIDAGKFHHTMDLIDAELHRSREDFIVHFKQTYSDAYPPAWILAEVLPFGVITNIFSNIKVARIKKSIARRFGLQVAPFESWLTHHTSNASKSNGWQLDNSAHWYTPHLLWPLHYQVFPKHHFAEQRHEGKDWCFALRLSIHWYKCNGLPPWVGMWTVVAIGTIIQGGRGWKLCTFSPFFWKNVFHLNLFRAFRVFMYEPSAHPPEVQWRYKITLIGANTQ